MRFTAGLALFALLATATLIRADADAPPASDDGKVIVLTDENFEAEAAKHDMLLVEFYAPWCGHCKRLEPEYKKAADLLAADPETANLRIAKCDADSQKKSGGKYGVSGFPTIKLFRFGDVAEEFDGERTAEGIVKYVKAKASVAVNKELTSAKAVKDATKGISRPALIGFFSSKNHIDYKIWKSVVTGFAGTGVDVYHTATPAVLESMGFYSEGSSIQMYRPTGKPAKVVYRGTLFKQTLKEWILENAFAPVSIYSPDTAKLFTMTGDSVVRVVAAPANMPKDVEAVLAPLAAEHKGTIRFATSAAADFLSDVEAHCTKGAKICLIAHEGAKTKRSRVFGLDVSASFSAGTVKSFVDDFVAKKLSVKVKSEPAGPAPKAGEVAVVVGTTFQELVIDSNKDLLVEFYAPWCGHCKALAPKYDELATALADRFSEVTIAKIDLTANDLPSDYKQAYNVEGFPTLYWAPKGKKGSPIKYDGAREVDAMKKWVEEHITKA